MSRWVSNNNPRTWDLSILLHDTNIFILRLKNKYGIRKDLGIDRYKDNNKDNNKDMVITKLMKKIMNNN